MAVELADFDVIAWTPADEARPAVELREVPAELSERGQRVLRANATLRAICDETGNGYPSDSERANAIAWHAGHLGLNKEDAAFLIADLYGRPGKKRLHLTKLRLTLRAWAKGREEAERDEVRVPAAPDPPSQMAPPPTSTPGACKAECYEVLTAAEYRRTSFAGARRLVPSIGLTEGGVGLVTGAGGDGKSLFALNLCAGWAGAPLPLAAAIPAARPLRSLLVYVEDLPGMVQERYRTLLGDAADPAGLAFFTRKEPMQFSGARGKPNDYALERLRVTLQKHGPFDVVTFDPLCYLHQAEENSSSEMMRWLVPLREVCRQAGAALLIVHHAGWAADGEDARGRGSTAIRAWADFEIALRAQTKNGRTLHRLNLVKCNFAPRWKEPLALELDPDTLRFQVVDEGEALCSPDALVAWMVEDLSGVWSEKRADLYDAICKRFGCSDKTARRSVATAIGEGKLRDQGQRKPLEVVTNSQEKLI